jgi:hypothetical protein
MHVSAAPPALVIISVFIGLSALARMGRRKRDRGAGAP